MAKRQFVIMYDPAWDGKPSRADSEKTASADGHDAAGPASSPPEPRSMGTRGEILKSLRAYNTGPDLEGGEFLYGPGITIQLPPVAAGDGGSGGGRDADHADLTQLFVALVEENIAWPVLTRICTARHWQLVDLETGRTLSFAGSAAQISDPANGPGNTNDGDDDGGQV